MEHHLLRVNGFAPSWIEESKDIDAAVSHFRADLRNARRLPVVKDEFRNRAAGAQPPHTHLQLEEPVSAVPQVAAGHRSGDPACRLAATLCYLGGGFQAEC